MQRERCARCGARCAVHVRQHARQQIADCDERRGRLRRRGLRYLAVRSRARAPRVCFPCAIVTCAIRALLVVRPYGPTDGTLLDHWPQLQRHVCAFSEPGGPSMMILCSMFVRLRVDCYARRLHRRGCSRFDCLGVQLDCLAARNARSAPCIARECIAHAIGESIGIDAREARFYLARRQFGRASSGAARKPACERFARDCGVGGCLGLRRRGYGRAWFG